MAERTRRRDGSQVRGVAGFLAEQGMARAVRVPGEVYPEDKPDADPQPEETLPVEDQKRITQSYLGMVASSGRDANPLAKQAYTDSWFRKLRPLEQHWVADQIDTPAKLRRKCVELGLI